MSPPVQVLSIETVGRDHWARRCRNYRLRTNLFAPAVREAADSPDERVCTHLVVPAPARRVVSAAVRDEGALRMRHTPCGCAPYGAGAIKQKTLHERLFRAAFE